MGRSAIKNWENGIDTIPLKRLNSFCNIFHVNMDYVCKFTNSKKHMDIIIDIDKREVGNRLLEIRKDHNDTQKYVANIIGIDQSNYSRYELGKNLILTSLLIVFCKYYNVSIDYVCGRSNNKEINEI